MNKYVVKLVHVFSTITEVEAESKDAAVDEAEKWFANTESKEDTKLYYEATMDKKNWAVLTIEEYEELKQKIKEGIEKQESSDIVTP